MTSYVKFAGLVAKAGGEIDSLGHNALLWTLNPIDLRDVPDVQLLR